MSDRKKVVVVPAQPATQKTVVTGQYCDRCGVDIPDPEPYWSRDFTLEFLEGDSYPEGTDLNGWALPDCCNDCVVVLRELLEVNGFKTVDVNN